MNEHSLPWDKRTIAFKDLRRYADQFRGFHSVVTWLYAIGVIPNNVINLQKARIIKTSIDPDAINCGYLVGSAVLWDEWGASDPHEFLNAIECELDGSDKKDLVADILAELGRQKAQEQQDDFDTWTM